MPPGFIDVVRGVPSGDEKEADMSSLEKSLESNMENNRYNKIKMS